MPTIQNAINTGVILVGCNFQYSTCVHLTGHCLLCAWPGELGWAGLGCMGWLGWAGWAADVIFIMKHSSP